MRIIAGKWRSTALAAVGKGDAGAHLRPTSDRVRESLFSLLTHLGVIDDAIVLDVFAGTGALSLEALSRGAACATLIENGRIAQRLIAQNLDKLRCHDQVQVVGTDATRLGAHGGEKFDLVFLDPPYGKSMGQQVLAALHSGGWLIDDATIVWEENTPMDAPAGYKMRDQRKYGDTHVTVLDYTG